MATIQYGNPLAKPKVKNAGLKNLGMAYLDAMTSPLSALGINYDPTYVGDNADKWNQFSNVIDTVGGIAGNVGLGALTGGIGNIGNMLIPQVTTGKYGGRMYKKGGLLTEYNGLPHSMGGIPISGTDEVEDKETSTDIDGGKYVFSDSILVPGTKETFAATSKKIANKYSKRPLDVWAQNAQKKQLITLAEQQEQIREAEGFNNNAQHAFGGKVKNPNEDLIVYDMNNAPNPFAKNLLPNKYVIQRNWKRKIINGEPSTTGVFVNDTVGVRYDPGILDLNTGKISTSKTLPPFVPKEEDVAELHKSGGWISSATAHMRKDKPCTGSKFGSSSCPPGSRRYNLARTFRKMNKHSGLGDESSWLGKHQMSVPDILMDKLKFNVSNFYNPEQPIGELPSMMTNITPLTPKNFLTNSTKFNNFNTKASEQVKVNNDNAASLLGGNYTPNYTIPMLGYAAQALSNIPLLTTKASNVKYDRITPEKVDLSLQRASAKTSRNNALAIARRNATLNPEAYGSTMGAMTADIFGQYGNTINNSLLNEATTNAQIINEARARNAAIQMQEAEANQREADAVRSAKLQGFSNLGQVAAAAGNTYQGMTNDANMLNLLSMSNPDYVLEWLNRQPYIKRKRSYGGKIRGGKK